MDSDDVGGGENAKGGDVCDGDVDGDAHGEEDGVTRGAAAADDDGDDDDDDDDMVLVLEFVVSPGLEVERWEEEGREDDERRCRTWSTLTPLMRRRSKADFNVVSFLMGKPISRHTRLE